MEYKNCSSAYWGEPDIELNFCENKYDNQYIAEYYNSMSAISYMIVGLILFFNKKKEAGIWTIILGIGTFIMHATLRYYGKWMDEISMLMLEMVGIKSLFRFKKKRIDYISLLIFVLYFLINSAIYFISIFFVLLLIIGYKTRDKLKDIKIKMYTFLMTISLIFWGIDILLCGYVNKYNFHALWHVGTSLAILFGFLSL